MFFLNDDFDIFAHQWQIRPVAFVKTDNVVEGLFCLAALTGGAGNHQLAGLPQIVVVVLNDRDIEFLMETRQDRFHQPPFGFERMAVGQVDG